MNLSHNGIKFSQPLSDDKKVFYFNNDPVKVFKHLYIRYNQILFRGDYHENIVFNLPSLAAAIIFGFSFVHCFRVIGI